MMDIYKLSGKEYSGLIRQRANPQPGFVISVLQPAELASHSLSLKFEVELESGTLQSRVW